MAGTRERGMLRILAAAAIVALLLAGCAGPTAAAPSVGTDDSGSSNLSAGLTQFEVGHRDVAPVVTGPNLTDGASVSSSHPGRVVVINVWRSDCGPCRAEGTALADAAQRTASESTFVGLDVNDQLASAQAFVRTSGSRYAHIFDSSGEQLLKFAGVLPLQAIPSTLVVDRQGRIAARIVGRVSTTSLAQLVSDVAVSA